MDKYSWNDIREGRIPNFVTSSEGEKFSYTQSPSTIFKKWENRANADFKNKTGMTYKQFEKKTSMFSQIYSGLNDGVLEKSINTNMVNVYNQIENNLEKYKKKIAEETGMATGAGFGAVIRKSVEATDEAFQASQDLLDTYGEFSNTMVTQLSSDLVDFANKGMLESEDTAKGVGGAELPKALSISKTAAKTLSQLDNIIAETQKVINKTEGQKTVSYKKLKWKDSKANPATLVENKTKERKKADSIIRAIGGQVSNAAGMLFEQAILVEGAKAMGGLVNTISQTGASNVEGTTSKADALMNITLDGRTYDIGFSVKKISKESGSSRYLDTNLEKVLEDYLNVETHAKIAIIIAHLEGKLGFNDANGLNKFISASIASIAIGGSKGSRADFIMYRNQGISLATRFSLEAKEQKFKMMLSAPRKKANAKIYKSTGEQFKSSNWIEERDIKKYTAITRAEFR